MSITSSVSQDGRTLSITVKGRFDFSLHRLFRDVYRNVDAQVFHYQIDLSQVDFIDSAALGMLLVFRERIGGDSSRVKITGCRNDVKKIMEVSNFHKMFEIESA
ncbi:MAG: STAS domain-containing protein [Chromatiaceae bacterium]|nr:STAS domain-containing protein [Gammaproteobacteria bacterium]MCP5426803.1 STAS domain-containing protein [Chromatiaceae bacterium]MCB1861525.1 STAS domain-containing protein [Gammaproteobacteria bacterium]MCB1872110.1 STAS domain-containing protein [Gammaproteobacteria bacterium]MCB1881147.1 STAS domain-containing protein [Gammaproteobacteria bacterium]